MLSRRPAVEWPTATRDAAWNEYDASGVLQHFVPADAQLTALAAEFEQARGSPDEKRKFQRMFEKAMVRWLESTVEVNGVESWRAFRGRVSGAIERVMAGPPAAASLFLPQAAPSAYPAIRPAGACQELFST